MESSSSDVEAGFAKLQGEDFEYYIVLGRNSKKSTVDVDLSSLGGGMNISRRHARIFYDFHRRRFALEVLGKNGCFVDGVLHLPGNPPVKLDSRDLLRIGDKEFYFLLPKRSILGGSVGKRDHVSGGYQMGSGSYGKKVRGLGSQYYDGYNAVGGGGEDGLFGGRRVRSGADVGVGGGGYGYGSGGKAGSLGQLDKRADGGSRVDREADNQQLLQLEEKDVVSSVATVLSDLCGPGDWMPMEKLHYELVEQFRDIWHHSRVRKYLTSEDHSSPEAKGKPWFGLLMLLRKYPEHFVINTRSKGRVTLEFVSLVSLLT